MTLCKALLGYFYFLKIIFLLKMKMEITTTYDITIYDNKIRTSPKLYKTKSK